MKNKKRKTGEELKEHKKKAKQSKVSSLVPYGLVGHWKRLA